MANCIEEINESVFRSSAAKVIAECTKLNPMYVEDTIPVCLYNEFFSDYPNYIEHPHMNKEGKIVPYVRGVNGTKPLKFEYEEIRELIKKFKYYPVRVVTIGNGALLFFKRTCVRFWHDYDEDDPNWIAGMFYTDNFEEAAELFEGVKFKEEQLKYSIASRHGDNIGTYCVKIPKFELDTKKNYNDDIPIGRIVELLGEDNGKLLLFHGTAGTGKTTLIKGLMNKLEDKRFIFVDSTLLTGIGDGALLSFFIENRGSVIILEDCEKLLMSRKNGGSSSGIATMLNLTDGIVGDSLKIKFICTFNCPLVEIDEALLRKGRLSLKYEFKELCLEKTKALYPEATQPMTLADIYNAEENDFSKEEKKRIGF